MNKRVSSRRVVLSRMIVPAALVTSASAADIILDGSQNPYNINSSPVFGEGLREGYMNASDDEGTPIGSAIIGPDNGQGFGISLGLRMAQIHEDPGGFTPFGWANPRTWIYSGEVFTGPNGVISFAANIDDTDYLRIDGSVVLNDNGWDTPRAVTVTGLAPNTWVGFEYRASDTGGGGAGPSGQNTLGGANWNATTGAVMSWNNENGSINANDYIGGTNDLGKPAETQDGTPQLFRYISTPGAGGDNLRVTASSTAALSGTATTVTESILQFQAGTTPTTLTVNSADAQLRTLAANLTSFGNASGAVAIFAGSADIRLGQTTDGSNTGVIIRKDGGTGDLIFNNSTNDLNGSTIQVLNGRVSIQGNGFNPVSTLATPIEINGVNAKLRFGGSGIDQTRTTFSTAININESGTLEHTSNRSDIVTGAVTIAPTKSLNADIAGGPLRLAGLVSGPTITKTGAGILALDGTVTVDTVAVAGGTLELAGNTTLTNTPIISAGGTLALTGGGASYTFPGPLVVPTGGTLRTFSAPIGTRQTNLTGGTLVLDGEHGLTGEYWNSNPPATDAGEGNGSTYLATWGPNILTQGVGVNGGPNTPGTGDFTAFQNAFAGLGGPGFTVNTALLGVTTFDFPSVTTAPFQVYGVTYADNIQARWTGKFFAPVAGVYALSTTSDDGSAVFVDGQSVVYNNRFQGMTNRGGTVFLQPGLHDIVMGFYEGGGGAGMQVFVTPPGGTNQLLNNAILYPTSTVPTFGNPIDIQQDSTVRTDYFGAVASEVSIQPGKKLTTEGNSLTVTSLKMRTSGTYTVNTSGATNILVASKIDDNSGAAALTLNKTGAGVFVLDNTTTAQLTNAANVININEGSLGILLQTGGLSPTGTSAINFNGGGIVLSSKGGNQTYNLPAGGFGGTAPQVAARQLGTGVAGPIDITLGGNLKVPNTQTLSLSTADNYTLLVGGTADLTGGAGTVSINGGKVVATTAGAMNGLNITFNTAGPAALNLRSSTTIASLSSANSGFPVVSLGNGTGTTTLTINQAGNTTYTGNITQETGSTGIVVKQGAGTLTLSGSGSTFSGGLRIEAGVVNAGGGAIGTGLVTLAGGTLQAAPSGLLGEYWDSTKGGDAGAQAGFSTDLAALNAYFASKGSAVVSAPTTTAGRVNLKFSDGGGLDGGGPDTATFADQGFTAPNNMAVRLSGNFFAALAGDYIFTTRSDDGSVLFVDGVKVVNNNNYQGMTNVSSAPVTLAAGNHTISVGFFEGTGGSGLEVRYTPPGGVDQFIANAVLGGLHGTNAVSLTASSTIDPAGGTIDLGVLTAQPNLTLTGLAGNANFTGTVLSGTGGNTYTFDKAAGVLNLGAITDGGNAVVINKTGVGRLLFGVPAAAQLTNAGTQVNVNGGSVVAVASSTLSSLGNATVNLNGGGLVLSSSEPTATFANSVNVSGASSLGAGNFGGGAVDNGAVTLSKPLVVNGGAGASLTMNTTNGYSLNLGSITGGGNLTVTGGTINTNGPVTAGVVNISGAGATPPAFVGGVLAANDNLTATSVTIGNSGALRTGGLVNAAGGITVNATGELQTVGGSINAPINVAGGLIRAQSGITDLGNSAVTFAAPSVTANAIRGVLHLTKGEFTNSVLPGNSDAGILGTQLRAPEATTSLTTALDIVNNNTADGRFSTLFNTNAAGQRFTAGFFGQLTATEGGLYQFQVATVDDLAGFWVDLNRNGVFESTGSAGAELISGQGCCGDGPIGEATLVAGQTYKIAFAVEDTGGDSGLTAKFKRPSDAGLINVNPGDAGQVGLWASNAASAGGGVIVEGTAELRASRLNGASVVTLTGDAARLRLSSASPVTDSVDGLSVIIGGGSGTLELAANNTVNAGTLTVSPTGTLIKTGAGTLTAASQSIGVGGTLQVDGGTVNLNGTTSAFSGNAIGQANSGNVVVNGGGLVNVNGSLSGLVTVNTGGRVGGTGTIGSLTVNSNGNANPGITTGTLNTGALMFAAGADVQLELVNLTTLDRFNVTGAVTLDQSDLFISYLSGYNIAVGDKFFIVVNDDVDPVVGTFAGLADGATVTSGLGQFRIDYDGDFGTGATGGGNDVVLTALVAVPEPSTILALLGGCGMLAGLRRFRRA